jgi:hypothetical protein
VYGFIPNFGTGKAARFANFNTSNSQPVASLSTNGTGSVLLANHTGASGSIAVFQSAGVNVARIDKTGKGFFNGNIQSSGADVAEVVPTAGSVPEPGDVVEIDPSAPNRFRLSTGANNPRVAGVITTDPGLMMNTHGATEGDPVGPGLALVGRVPVKTTLEGGAIRIGDLLVAARTPGRAMRAPAHPEPGTVIGKALQASTTSTDVIEMLVMLR